MTNQNEKGIMTVHILAIDNYYMLFNSMAPNDPRGPFLSIEECEKSLKEFTDDMEIRNKIGAKVYSANIVKSFMIYKDKP